MSTSGGFNPGSVPECPYAPRMTRAQALALRTAGGLRENCVVVITDGPVIGTAGATSPTEIELNPVGPSELGLAARVHTTFAASAWDGLYDIDLGASGSITRLTDDVNNTAVDVDSGAATVHTQFPWHLGGASLRDNYVQDSVLTGWDTQVGTILRNNIRNATVNLTGKTAGTVQSNEITNTTVVLGAGGASGSLFRNRLIGNNAAATTINHTGPGTLSFSDTIMRDGFIVAHSGTGNLTVTNSTLENHGTAVADLNHATTGTATTSISDSQIIARTNAQPVIDNQGAGGSFGIAQCEIVAALISKAAGSVGPLQIQTSRLTSTTVTIGAANAALTNFFGNCRLDVGQYNLLGPVAAPGRNDFTTVRGALAVNVAATATAGVNVNGGFHSGGTINQNRTGGTETTAFFDCELTGASTVVTDNGTTDPTQGLNFNRCRFVDSIVTVGDIGVKGVGQGTIAQQVEMIGSTLNLSGMPGLSFMHKGRLLSATLTNGGFQAETFELVGLTKVMTADQPVNRKGDVSFDNWV